MKLITKALENKLRKFPPHAQEGKGENAEIIVKFFGGCAYTFLATEAEFTEDGDIYFFGKATLDGSFWEWGSVSLKELQSIRFPPFGLPIERDRYLESGITVAEYLKR